MTMTPASIALEGAARAVFAEAAAMRVESVRYLDEGAKGAASVRAHEANGMALAALIIRGLHEQPAMDKADDAPKVLRAEVRALPQFSGDGYDYGGGVVLCIGTVAIPFGEHSDAVKLAHEIARRWNATADDVTVNAPAEGMHLVVQHTENANAKRP